MFEVVDQQSEPVEEVATSDLLAVVAGMGLTRISRHLEEREQRRCTRLFHLMTSPALPAIDEVLRLFDLSAEGAKQYGPAALPDLIHRGRRDFEDMLDGLLVGAHPPMANAARDVMELEWLLRDIVRDPGQLEVWANADEKTRRREFSPIAMRKRLAQVAHPGLDLPETPEYQVHSASLHVTPGREEIDERFENDPGPGVVFFWVHEILEHTRRLFVPMDQLLRIYSSGQWASAATDRFRLGWAFCAQVVNDHKAELPPGALPERVPRPRR